MRLVQTLRSGWRAWGSVAVVAAGMAAVAAPLSAHAQNRYTYNGAEATDANTGLVWQRCSAGLTWNATAAACTGTIVRMTWPKALAYAQAEAAKTGVAWRLPNIKELVSLVTERRGNPPISAAAFPQTLVEAYWSSTPYASNLSTAWAVYFTDGHTNFEVHSIAFPVRLVRDAP